MRIFGREEIPAFLLRDDWERIGDDPVRQALAHAVLGELCVPGLQPFGNDELMTEHAAHDWGNTAVVYYDAIARRWLVVCSECGFVAVTTHGSISIDGGVGSREDAAAYMQEACDPDAQQGGEVAVALARIEQVLQTIPCVIMTTSEQQQVYELLGLALYDVDAGLQRKQKRSGR